MDKGRVGEYRGSQEMDRRPLTACLQVTKSIKVFQGIQQSCPIPCWW
jgi:hypothetical protein